MSTRSSLSFSIIGQLLAKIINLISVVIIARLLTPDELGIFAIASSIAYIAAEFRVLGTGSYLIREQTAEEDKQRNVLGLSMLFSWGLGLLMLIGALPTAKFYSYPELQVIFSIFSISFFIAPFSVVPNAMLTRAFNFRVLFIIKLFSVIAGFIVTMTLVVKGFSFYGLAIGSVTTVATDLLITYLLKKELLIWKPKLSAIKEILNFGMLTAMSNLLNRLTTFSSDIIIGKIGNARDVALFSRGVGFLDFLSTTLSMGIRPVALPYLSNTYNKEGNDVLPAYLRATNMLGTIVWPSLAIAGIAAYPVILFMFGEQWVAVPKLVTYLSFAVLLKSIHSLSTELFLAAKLQKILFIKTLSVFILTFISIFLSYSYGLLATAKTMVFVGCFEFILTSYFIIKYFGLTVVQLFSSIWRNVILVLICIIATVAIDLLLPFKSLTPLNGILLTLLINIPVWLIAIKFLKLELYFELKQLLQRRFQK